jgi:hypothetical protein
MFLTRRGRIFLFGCIGVRITIFLIAKYIGENKRWLLPYLGMFALLPAIGFISIFLGDFRKKGMEAGGPIWWNDMRPIHGAMYLLFAVFAFKKKPFAWKVLMVDVLIGLFAWVKHYF